MQTTETTTIWTVVHLKMGGASSPTPFYANNKDSEPIIRNPHY